MAGVKSSTVAFMVAMIMMVASTSMAQTRHVVGDTTGWTIPANGAADYSNWASRQTFNVGDSLFFNFTTGLHNVAEVSQAAFGPCTTANPISITTTGPATVALTTAGTHHFICTVGTHCQIGQKLAVNVSAAAAAPTTPPPATAPTTSPPAATPTPTPTPTPAPVSPPTTPTPTPGPAPSTTTSPPTSSPEPSPAESSPPAPTPSGLSPSGSTTPSPAGDTTPPSPSTAARTFTAAVPAGFLAVALAFFY